MQRYIAKTIAVGTVSEELAEIVTAGEGFQRSLVGVLFETIADLAFRVYIGTDRIFEVSGDIVTDAVQPLLINRPLVNGETVRAGWYNGTAGSLTHDFTVIIEEKASGG